MNAFKNYLMLHFYKCKKYQQEHSENYVFIYNVYCDNCGRNSVNFKPNIDSFGNKI